MKPLMIAAAVASALFAGSFVDASLTKDAPASHDTTCFAYSMWGRTELTKLGYDTGITELDLRRKILMVYTDVDFRRAEKIIKALSGTSINDRDAKAIVSECMEYAAAVLTSR